ncbi:hypothetical protein BGX24_011383 [Mortierella sp. AD032]|nr:hypothetical protein BGX24_011383 [Mortierella sp. AD032]
MHPALGSKLASGIVFCLTRGKNNHKGAWYNIKVLTAGVTPEEGERHQKQALSGETQMDATSVVIRACDVCSAKLTHSGRHVGVSEAYGKGLSMDDIRHLGRWVMEQMENFYAPKNPTRGAFCLTHFGPQEPYVLDRDLVMPPINLQRRILSWIEAIFDHDIPGKAKTWRSECKKEMLGVGPNTATKEDIFLESI